MTAAAPPAPQSELDRAVQLVADSWPKLTETQLDRIAGLLNAGKPLPTRKARSTTRGRRKSA